MSGPPDHPWRAFIDCCNRCYRHRRNPTLPDHIVRREPESGVRFAYVCDVGHWWECSWADYGGVAALQVLPCAPAESIRIEGEDAS